MNQLTKLNGKTLIGSTELPRFMFSEFISRLEADAKLKFTVRALKQGLPILAGPMVDVEPA
jgi:hypothetical protein